MKKCLVLMVLFVFCMIGPSWGLAQTASGKDAAHHLETAAEGPKDVSGIPSSEGEAVGQTAEDTPMSMMPMMMGPKMMRMMMHQMAGNKVSMMSKMMAGMMGMGPKDGVSGEMKKPGMMMKEMGMMKMKSGHRGKMAFIDLARLGLTPEQKGKIRDISYEHLKKMQQLSSENDLLEIEASYLMSADQVDEKKAKEVFARLGEIKLESFLAGRHYLEVVTELLSDEQKMKLESGHK